MRTWGGGEAAIVTEILTHVVLRQEAHQRKWLDFSSLTLEEDARHTVKTELQPTQTAGGAGGAGEGGGW